MRDALIVIAMSAAPFLLIGLAWLIGSIIRFGAGDASTMPVWLLSRRKRLTHRKTQDVVGPQ